MASGPTSVNVGHTSVRQREVGAFRVSDTVYYAGLHIPSHYHERACISVIVSGCIVQRFPGREVRCPAGGILVKPPGERHIDTWAAESRHLIVEPDAAGEASLGSVARVANEVRSGVDPGAAALSRLLFQELRRDDDLSDLALEGLVLQLLARVGRMPRPPSGARRPGWLRRVEQRLREDFRSAPRLAELGALAGVHPSYVSRTFGAVHGRTIGAYLRELRLEAARAELTQSDRPLAEVALRAGFSDQSHMTRELRRATGLTPARYRAIFRGRSPLEPPEGEAD